MSENGIRFIEPPQPDARIVACELDGTLNAEGMKALVDKIQAVVDSGEKAHLYVDMRNYDGFEFGAVTEKLKHVSTLWNGFDKYAVVGDVRWVEIWIGIVDPITPQHMKHFSGDNVDDAWTWLSAPEASEGAEASEA